eukprot:TRINITY_DN1491_c0_g1_i1.p1 TRINITY_DN1491_c0_g1~~TRINITY_DN1491_c0_g1_i1.p1  ORF type:complete len:376 (+),score=46.68 TRINITY_DN1491_c0_g1_i1:43-1128(+)
MGLIQTPLQPPPFTIKQLRDAIPSYCFERSALKSASYLAFDLVMISSLFFVASFFGAAPVWAQFFLWPIYWVVQGIFMFGVWIVAHECGHQAFSESKILNDFVGLIFHSLLLVPYHAWRISHGMHHKATGHFERDQPFIPKTRSEVTHPVLMKVVEETPLWTFIFIGTKLLLGFPLYLLMNSSSHTHSRRTNHFEPSSPIFKPKHVWDIIVSDIALVIVLLGLGWFSRTYSFLSLTKYYIIPYLWVNVWLVIITLLQHTDKGIPHYRGKEWTFIRVALATVDRDYGILNHLFHHITDSHVAHHLFSTMPHYHAIEATKHLKKILGKYYLSDDTPIVQALWKSSRECQFVEDRGDILWYKAK